MTSVGVRQHTQDVRGCLWLSVSTHRTFVAVRVCPSAHIGRPWLSISTHISTLVLGLSMLTLLVDCSGDFGPRGLSVQCTQDVRGCPAAHTGCMCVSVCYTRHPRLSVCVRQHTQDFRGCPSVQISARWSLDSACSPFPWNVLVILAHVGCLFSTHRSSVGVRQHTQDVCGCPCVSVCFCVFLSAHTGHPWLSISTHISTLVLGLSTLAFPVDCLGDFGPRGLSVQYTQDVRGCPEAHTGRPWLSVSTLRTSVAVRMCPCVSVSTHRTSVAVHHTYMTSVGVRQHTQDVRGCLWLSVTTHRTFVAVRLCPSAHIGRPWLSISTHISTLVLGLSMLTLLVDCSGDFGPRGLSVQCTQDVRGCPAAHTGCLCVSVCYTRHPRLSVCVRQHTQDFRGCPSVHISARWSLDSACSPFPWNVLVILAHVGCLFSTHRSSVGVRQHTQDVCGCPCVSVCFCVFLSAHTGHPWLSISTHISTLVHGLSTLAFPVDCLGDFGPRGLSVQYTQDVRGCPEAHTGRPWLSVSTLRTSVAVRMCPCVSVSTHRTSVAVHQYTYQHAATEPEVNPKPYLTSQGAKQNTCALKMLYLTNQEGLSHEDNFYGFYTQEGVQANWNWAKIFTEQEVMNFATQRFLSPSICEYPTLEGDSSPRKERPEAKPIIGVKRSLSAFQKAKDQKKWTRKSEDMFNFPEPVKPVLHSPQLEANRFNQLQTRNWRPGDHLNQSGGIPEVLSCTRTQEISRFNGESLKSNRSYLWKDWTIFRFDPFQAIPIQPGEPDDVQTKPRHPGDIIQEPEEFYNFIPCTSPHRNKKIPIITKLPYLESLAFKLQQLFFYQGKDEISIYQAFKKVPRKLSYPLKPSRFKKNQVSHLEPKSHKRLQRLVSDFVSLLDLFPFFSSYER
ncbi:hypothetical protein YC2023_065990 [Brassica napus]